MPVEKFQTVFRADIPQVDIPQKHLPVGVRTNTSTTCEGLTIRTECHAYNWYPPHIATERFQEGSRVSIPQVDNRGFARASTP